MSAFSSRMLGPFFPHALRPTIPSSLRTHQYQDGHKLLVQPEERVWASQGMPESGWSQEPPRQASSLDLRVSYH